MAKIGFAKLGLKKQEDIVNVKFFNQDIEIKQYLPIEEKIDFITIVLEASHDQNNFANPLKVMVYTMLQLTEKYTNINFTEKQKENPMKLYDLINSNGLIELILNNVPEKEIKELFDAIEKTIVSVYKYQNSILGIMDTMSSDYQALELDANKIHQTMSEPNNMYFLRQVMSKLG